MVLASLDGSKTIHGYSSCIGSPIGIRGTAYGANNQFPSQFPIDFLGQLDQTIRPWIG